MLGAFLDAVSLNSHHQLQDTGDFNSDEAEVHQGQFA